MHTDHRYCDTSRERLRMHVLSVQLSLLSASNTDNDNVPPACRTDDQCVSVAQSANHVGSSFHAHLTKQRGKNLADCLCILLRISRLPMLIVDTSHSKPGFTSFGPLKATSEALAKVSSGESCSTHCVNTIAQELGLDLESSCGISMSERSFPPLTLVPFSVM